MIQTVLKRDGRVVGFNEEKIATAIRKAMLHTDKGEDLQLIHQITDRISFKGDSQMTVEAIQDLVEVELMKSSRKDVAQKYIAYRNQRSIARKAKTRDMFLEIINIKSNDITRENANMNADTPAGMMMKFASETTKPFVDDYLLSEEVLDAVTQNYLHIHDKDYYPTKSLTCVQHPLDHILKYGFSAGHGESRPAKRIETASILGCISLETAQNEMHGGQAIPAFDFYLAPYVRNSFIEEVKNLEELNGKDYSHLYQKELADYLLQPLDGLTGEDRIVQHAVNKTVSRVHQSMEAFIHNMNTIHSRGGNQVVFSSINYGTDTSAEGRCIIRELLKSTYQGVGNGETAIFPIQIWKKKRGVSYLPEDRNYDLYQLACKVTARRFFPNFLNLDATFNQSEDWKADDPKRYQHEVATMGCRTRVFENRFGPKTSIGRGNISFSTINIVRLGIECMNIEDKEQRIARFFAKLDSMLEVTARQLHERMEFQKTAFAKQFPLLMSALWIGSEKLKPNDTIASVINQGTLGIGFIGLAECLVALLGKHHGESGEAQELGLKIVTYMRDRANQFSEQYQHNYSVLAIALAVMHDPELLILDEPINGLDPIGIAEVRSFIRELCDARGKTILISSHILSEISLLADDIGIIDHGALLEEESLAELEQKSSKHIRFTLSDTAQAARILERNFHENHFSIQDDHNLRLHNLDLPVGKIVTAFVENGLEVSEVHTCEESLEDYFKRVTGGEGIA